MEEILEIVIPVGLAILSWMYLGREHAEKERERLKEEALQEERKEQDYEDKQFEYYYSLNCIAEDSLVSFETAPKLLVQVKDLLDRANDDFQERAFGPFWDSIEQAALQLGAVDDRVQSITINTKRYLTVATEYDGTAEVFPIPNSAVGELRKASSKTVQHMATLVRKAQCDFEFALIFEQRRTNKILLAGFTNLADVLEGIETRIGDSLDALAKQISLGSKELASKLEGLEESSAEHARLNERLVQALEKIHDHQQGDR